MKSFEEEMESLRELYSPSEQDQQRVRSALNVSLGAGALGAGELLGRAGELGTSHPPAALAGDLAAGQAGTASTGAGTSLSASVGLKVIVSVGVAALAAAVAVPSMMGGPESEPASESRPTQDSAEASSQQGVSESATMKEVTQDRPTKGNSAAAETAAAGLSVPNSPAPRRMSVTAPEREVGSSYQPKGGSAHEGSVGEETVLLSRASRALRKGDPTAAEKALDRHAAQFDDGTLAPEREGLRILSACRAELTARARQQATDFVTRFPHSPLVKHLRSACLEGTDPALSHAKELAR